MINRQENHDESGVVFEYRGKDIDGNNVWRVYGNRSTKGVWAQNNGEKIIDCHEVSPGYFRPVAR